VEKPNSVIVYGYNKYLVEQFTQEIYQKENLIGLAMCDQFQQLEAICSCKTRHFALYVETHYNIASKRAFPNGVSTGDSLYYFIYAYF